MELTANDFDPKNGNFYSNGLFQWLKKNKRYNKIYMATWNSITGHDPENPVMMIGRIDDCGWFFGNRLKSVCRVRGDRTVFAFGSKEFNVHEWTDVTEYFIAKYKSRGMCHIHGDSAHELEDVSNDIRRCNRCGDVFKANRYDVLVSKVEWIKQ